MILKAGYMVKNKKIVVFASGSGTNFINIHENINKGRVVLLISNNPKCGAINYAMANNIDYKIINDFRYPDNKDIEYEIVLNKYNPDLILLAGFMKKIPADLIKIYRNKILNIHPSLLPDYGGKGFFGMNVHNAVFNSNEKFSGATVHYVNKEYDRGPILIQKKVEIQSCKDPNEIAKKVLKIEHEIFPKAVQIFLNKT